jgi:4-diphosphocytidyl-2-C-methyl-D-erythritol kinase
LSRVEPDVLAEIAFSLGADVPVCLAARPMRMTGVGERLATVPPPPRCGLALVNPGIPVATAAVFARRSGTFSVPARLSPAWRDVRALAADLQGTANDLEAPAIAICPVITECLAALACQPDVLIARMSGSGATCFGLFPTPASAARAAQALAQPGWWSWGGALRGSGPDL